MAKQVTGLSSLQSTPSVKSSLSGVFGARVRYTILDDKTEPTVFKEFGEWSSIGSLFFSKLNNPNPAKNFTTDNFAKPLFPNNKIFPLENEIVYILPLPNSDIQGDVNDVSFYYFQPVNIWNSVHHNAIPDPINGNSLPPSQQQDYEQTEAGAVRRVTDGGSEIDLGNTFVEKLDIKNLQPFEGDIFYEGRWGQSLRFGSTVNDSPILNPWSRTGNNGDPLTILRNSQYNDGKDAWIPQVEDINKQGSSVYMTSTQAIPIEVSSKSYSSYKTAPTSPDKFAGEQIILNSGRLLFNTKSDSILMSSKNSINLNAVNDVNIDAPRTVIQSKTVKLGDRDAFESVILGDKFFSDLSRLLTQMISLGTSLPSITPPNPAIATAATAMTQVATQVLNSIETYKSKTTKTK
tara:strand:- start:1092 stop:2306 length:1215 start_codon:yes stop_codon:yes gene_type:complete